jgi:hypothetical protein
VPIKVATSNAEKKEAKAATEDVVNGAASDAKHAPDLSEGGRGDAGEDRLQVEESRRAADEGLLEDGSAETKMVETNSDEAAMQLVDPELEKGDAVNADGVNEAGAEKEAGSGNEEAGMEEESVNGNVGAGNGNEEAVMEAEEEAGNGNEEEEMTEEQNAAVAIELEERADEELDFDEDVLFIEDNDILDFEDDSKKPVTNFGSADKKSDEADKRDSDGVEETDVATASSTAVSASAEMPPEAVTSEETFTEKGRLVQLKKPPKESGKVVSAIIELLTGSMAKTKVTVVNRDRFYKTISAGHFSDKFSSSNCGQISTQKQHI